MGREAGGSPEDAWMSGLASVLEATGTHGGLVGGEVLSLGRGQMEGWEEQYGSLWADGNYS